ncbi:MAG: ScpA family protein [Coriobacteriia bacterium]|nr:ScpA family protein [Coriobacteriia bacterium]
MSYQVKTQIFEGPFDLLLTLVTKQKLDVGAIELSDIVDQYLQELPDLDSLDLELASDFLMVASSLLELKARALLPREDKTDSYSLDADDFDLEAMSAEEIRDVLVERLLEYKKFKSVSAMLQNRYEQESYMHTRNAGPDAQFLSIVPDYLEGMTLRSIAVIAADMLCNHQKFLLEAEHIAPKRQSVQSHIKILSHLIAQRGQTSFRELMGDNPRVEEIVLTFLTLLELYKQNEIELSQEELFGDIRVKQKERGA